jgi:hypothetical protein
MLGEGGQDVSFLRKQEARLLCRFFRTLRFQIPPQRELPEKTPISPRLLETGLIPLEGEPDQMRKH